MTDGIITKSCSKCNRNLPTSGFSKKRSAKDGLQAKCKDCDRARLEAWREANPERVRAQVKAWREANPEKRRAQKHSRRACKRNAEGTHNSAQIRARTAVHGGSCIYCASNQDLHLDHIKPLSRGGSNWPSNLAPACATCNISKGAKWGADLLGWIEQNCTVERTRKILSTLLG